MDVGDRLLEAKKALDHGQWDDWLSDNFALSDRTARQYMQLAGHRKRVEAKMATVATLGIRGALEQISEDQVQEGKEKRNRELLARELAERSSRVGPEPPDRMSGPASYPRDYTRQTPVHSLEALNAERVRRVVFSIFERIETERKWLAEAGLLEQFDMELKAVVERLLGSPPPQRDVTRVRDVTIGSWNHVSARKLPSPNCRDRLPPPCLTQAPPSRG
jgi:hypothetical protein